MFHCIWFNDIHDWLVVDLPLWKMMEFVSWDYELPNIWKFMFQTTNQMKSICFFIFMHIHAYGYGSIPISTIFRVMNIHLPAILRFTRGTRFWPIPISCISQQSYPQRSQRRPRLNRAIRAVRRTRRIRVSRTAPETCPVCASGVVVFKGLNKTPKTWVIKCPHWTSPNH